MTTASQLGSAERWQAATGRNAPPTLTGKLLAAALAYEEQCKAHGGLSLPERRRLIAHLPRKGVGRQSHPRAHLQAQARAQAQLPSTRPANTATRDFAIGTQFVREWKGKDHIVTAVAQGFLWNGTTHASLSATARAITGTRWNGPRFFGLNRKAGAK